jgi:NADH-quinone oxidoreductase subunit L
VRPTSVTPGPREQVRALAIAVAIATLGIAASVMVYGKQKAKADRTAGPAQGLVLRQGRRRAFMGGPGRKAFDAVAWFDKNVVDGAVNGVANSCEGTAGQARKAPERLRPQLRGRTRRGSSCSSSGWFVVVRGIL